MKLGLHTMAGQKKEHIYVQNARVHNLKNLSVNIPRNHFVVITGVSGSGSHII